MIVTDVRQKLLIFTDDVGISQKTLAKELNYNYQHFIAVMKGRYDISDRFYKQVENLFRRYGYDKGLDYKGEL